MPSIKINPLSNHKKPEPKNMRITAPKRISARASQYRAGSNQVGSELLLSLIAQAAIDAQMSGGNISMPTSPHQTSQKTTTRVTNISARVSPEPFMEAFQELFTTTSQYLIQINDTHQIKSIIANFTKQFITLKKTMEMITKNMLR